MGALDGLYPVRYSAPASPLGVTEWDVRYWVYTYANGTVTRAVNPIHERTWFDPTGVVSIIEETTHVTSTYTLTKETHSREVTL